MINSIFDFYIPNMPELMVSNKTSNWEEFNKKHKESFSPKLKNKIQQINSYIKSLKNIKLSNNEIMINKFVFFNTFNKKILKDIETELNPFIKKEFGEFEKFLINVYRFVLIPLQINIININDKENFIANHLVHCPANSRLFSATLCSGTNWQHCFLVGCTGYHIDHFCRSTFFPFRR